MRLAFSNIFVHLYYYTLHCIVTFSLFLTLEYILIGFLCTLKNNQQYIHLTSFYRFCPQWTVNFVNRGWQVSANLIVERKQVCFKSCYQLNECLIHLVLSAAQYISGFIYDSFALIDTKDYIQFFSAIRNSLLKWVESQFSPWKRI